MFSCCMAWIIIDRDGEPHTDIEGNLILVDTEAAAREWLMCDDLGVERFDHWVDSEAAR